MIEKFNRDFPPQSRVEIRTVPLTIGANEAQSSGIVAGYVAESDGSLGYFRHTMLWG